MASPFFNIQDIDDTVALQPGDVVAVTDPYSEDSFRIRVGMVHANPAKGIKTIDITSGLGEDSSDARTDNLERFTFTKRDHEEFKTDLAIILRETEPELVVIDPSMWAATVDDNKDPVANTQAYLRAVRDAAQGHDAVVVVFIPLPRDKSRETFFDTVEGLVDIAVYTVDDRINYEYVRVTHVRDYKAGEERIVETENFQFPSL